MQQIEEICTTKQYQTDFVCTYQLVKDPDEAEILYQIQFLQAFSLAAFDDTIINNISEELFKKFARNEHILRLMSYYDNYWNADIRFRLCFSYSSFHVIHRILCALITEEPLTENMLDNLFNKLSIE